MNWSASVLSTISSDTEPTIVITFDSAKYVFNVGENTNRAFLQSRRNWKRTRALFLTQVGTHRTSGLPGLLMSFADATIPRLDIVGPPGLTHLLAAMRLYTFRDTMPIRPTEASWTSSTSSSHSLYKDENITVYSIPVLPSSRVHFASYSIAEPVSSSPTPDVPLKRKRELSPDLPAKRPSLEAADYEAPHLSSLQDMMKQSGFSPGNLGGETAQEWRRLMINIMFPGSKEKKPDTEQHKNKKKKGKEPKGAPSQTISTTSGSKGSRKDPNPSRGKTESQEGATKADAPVEMITPSGPPAAGNTADSVLQTSNIDEYKRARLPPGFHKQLPRYTDPYIPGASGESLASATLAYIVVGPRVRGKFDVKKAEALGVPFGPMRGQLTKGLTITFKVKVGDEVVERVVRPEECVGESETPGVILILDIPTPAHIASLISSFEDSPFYRKFRPKQPEDSKEYVVRSIFHTCGNDVLEDPRYVEFMNGFGPDAHHLIASREHGPDFVTFTSAAFNQLRLNQLDPEIFPLPKFSLEHGKALTKVANIPETAHSMASNLLIKMRPPAPPTKAKDIDDADLFHPAITSPHNISLPVLTQQRFAESKKIVHDHIESGKVHIPRGADVGILPLGTGSAVPTKYRNVSSTLIQIPRWGNILLDAGEGTWGQLVRHFGLHNSSSPNVWQVLRDLKCIFISHIHGDHHMGVPQILAKRRMLDPPPSEPLYLVSVRAVHLYLRELSDLQGLGLDDLTGNGVITVMSEALHWRNPAAYQKAGIWQIGGDEPWTDIQTSRSNADDMCRVLGLESFQSVDVYHRTRCYGAVIKHTEGWSIVFSGDTQPTNTLVSAGRGATVLIHEATMADDQSDLAKKKAHSTCGQAIEIGKRMGAEHILLTHFSARYPKMPPLAIVRPDGLDGSQRRPKEPVVALAFDHANLKIGNLWKLNFYLPAVEQCFEDTVEDDDDEDAGMVAHVDVDVS